MGFIWSFVLLCSLGEFCKIDTRIKNLRNYSSCFSLLGSAILSFSFLMYYSHDYLRCCYSWDLLIPSQWLILIGTILIMIESVGELFLLQYLQGDFSELILDSDSYYDVV